MIDVPISNCIHSDINRIYVLTQFNSVSLHRHIRQTYNFDVFSKGFTRFWLLSERPTKVLTGIRAQRMPSESSCDC
ncbi:MAG: sugar phosphate nucleotidyltransferase [Planctomycetaceae bacterium]